MDKYKEESNLNSVFPISGWHVSKEQNQTETYQSHFSLIYTPTFVHITEAKVYKEHGSGNRLKFYGRANHPATVFTILLLRFRCIFPEFSRHEMYTCVVPVSGYVGITSRCVILTTNLLYGRSNQRMIVDHLA